jgi:hypothetical protein
MRTLEEAKAYLEQKFEDGANCPCCGQLVKLYERRLNMAQMIGLIRLVQLYEEEERYYHVTELNVCRTGGEFARLERYGLIAEETNDDPTKRTSGMWRPTQLGIDFACGMVSVPRSCYMFNGSIYGFGDKKVFIYEVMKDKFDYSRLMEREDSYERN